MNGKQETELDLKVQVTIEQDPDTLALSLIVYVPSAVKPGLQGRAEVPLDTGRDQSQQVGLVAGATAEYLCENYDDIIDPSTMVKTAMECYAELCAENPHIF
jgi:hypothetical protein